MTAAGFFDSDTLALAIDRNPLQVKPVTMVSEAIAMLDEHGASCILAVDDDGHLVGILTERDVVRISRQATPVDRLPIQAVMSQPVISRQASALTDIVEILTIFQNQRIRHLPIVDDRNCLIGVITPSTLAAIWTPGLARNAGQNTEFRLRESEQRYASLAAAVPVGIFRTDVEGQCYYVNERWCQIVGMSTAAASGNGWSEGMHPEDRDYIVAEWQQATQEQRLFQLEYRVQHADGQVIWVYCQAETERDAAGQVMGYVGTLTDITERKDTEQQLQNLIESTASTTGQDFFPALVRHIAQALNVSYAMLTEKIGEELQVLAFWANGALLPVFSFPLARTPCEQALAKGRYYCESLVQQQFPANLNLVAMGVHSYLGIALQDAQGQMLGNLCVLDRQSIRDPQRAENLLRVFAVRATAELERERTAQALALLNRELELRVKDRTAALQKSEYRYRTLMEGASDAIILSDMLGNIIQGNREAELLLGCSPGELSRLSLSQIHPPEALTVLLNHLQEVGVNQIAPRLESIAMRRDGSLVAVEISGSRMEIDGEHICLGILRDITDRQQAALALEQEALRRTTIFNASSDGIHVIDMAGNLLEANHRFAQMLGYSLPEMAGFNVSDWDARWSAAELKEILADESLNDTVFETLHRRQDGSIFPVEISRRLMEWQGESILVNIARDITERQAALRERQEYEQRLETSNAELLRATRLKDEFLANMSHELRTPLNAILGLSESFLDGILGSISEQQKKAIGTIEQSGQHLLDLINDILEVSKIEAGQLELKITTVAVQDLCASSLTLVKQQALIKQIQLMSDISPTLSNIEVDDRRMRQVLINLLNNAVKFTPPGGQVKLSVALERHPNLSSIAWIVFTVTDTGIGITSADQSKLFQPFIQIDSSLNRRYEGTGLGLTLVKQIVELHGGTVSLTSAVGQGSCFAVRLPYHGSLEPEMGAIPPSWRKDLNADSAPRPVPLAVERPLILLVEDNQDNIDTLSAYLEMQNYRLILARNGQEAIDLTQAQSPDLILMDIQMPGVDGLVAMQVIRQDVQRRQVPIIALTALVMEGDQERCLAAGASDYVAKPVQLKQLNLRIRHWLQVQN